ncbi:TPA_asm: MC009.2R [Molluscum contagiosum virus]|nr:TPA_asm: MC009.2R [Molluscum contagiosum virus]
MHVVSLSNCLADDTETKTQNLTHALHTHSAHRAAPPDERRARPRPAHHHKIAVIFSVWRRPRRGGTAASTNAKKRSSFYSTSMRIQKTEGTVARSRSPQLCGGKHAHSCGHA